MTSNFLDNTCTKKQNMAFKTSQMDQIALEYWYYGFLGRLRVDGRGFLYQTPILKNCSPEQKSSCRTCAEACHSPFKWSPYWLLILVNSGFRNINLAANIPFLFTSCSRIFKCLIVNCPMWSTVQNISQSRKRCFPHDSWSCPWEKYSKPLYVFFLPLSTENTSTRSLVRSSL